MEHVAQSPALSSEALDELSIRCLLLPLASLTLLIPNTLVAEVIDYRPAEHVGHMPKWMRGMLSWRGRNVPVLSFEQLVGTDAADSSAKERRYVICNTLNGNGRLPFIALEVQGIPRLMQVDNAMLAYEDEGEKDAPVVLARLRLDEERVTVPNIDVMEKMVEQIGFVSG